MHFRILSFSLIALLSNSLAMADSFCGFDTGLVGTKAVGYVDPYSLDETITERERCEVLAFETPSDEAISTHLKCTDFLAVPSVYINNYEEEGFDPTQTDYFKFQVFDAIENWAQVSLKSGARKWVKKKNGYNFYLPYQFKTNETAISFTDGYPTQGAVYAAPRLDKPDNYHGNYLRALSDGWIDKHVSYDFFNSEIFKILEKHKLFNPDHIETASLATHYKDFLHIFYDVTAIIRDDEGREWLKAQEALALSYHPLSSYVYKGLQAQGKSELEIQTIDSEMYKLFWDNVRSKPGRTIYFPYRDPSGTITMVMGDGPNCGC